MTGLIVEQYVFKYLLDLKFPQITSHLRRLMFDINPVIVQWFLCLFVSVFPLEVSTCSKGLGVASLIFFVAVRCSSSRNFFVWRWQIFVSFGIVSFQVERKSNYENDRVWRRVYVITEHYICYQYQRSDTGKSRLMYHCVDFYVGI